MAAPMIDGGLRTFFRFDIRFLHRKAETMKDTTDLRAGIRFAPFSENEIGDDSRRPSVGKISSGFCPFENDRFEFAFLHGIDLGRTDELWFASETVEVVASNGVPVKCLEFSHVNI